MSTPNATPAQKRGKDATTLADLLTEQPWDGEEVFVVSGDVRLRLDEVRDRTEKLADGLRSAGVGPGLAVATVVETGIPALISMFAVWRAGGVHVPINGRFTTSEVASVLAETPVGLLVGSPAALAAHDGSTTAGAVELDSQSLTGTVVRPADTSLHRYDPDVALALRTSGTTGRPKAVLLRHSGTIASLDASIRKLRRGAPLDTSRSLRLNIIPTSLSLWAGIYNTVFSVRAGFGVLLLDKFTVEGFVSAVHEYDIRSTVLAPAMITMLADAPEVSSLGPLRLVRSITAALSPTVARRFHERFGAFVLNCYGQTELGGEVVGWTTADVRDFGETKLGSAGRPYEDVELRICGPDGEVLGPGEYGEIHVHSPFRMQGYAGVGDSAEAVDDSRFVDGFLRTGDLGCIDSDGFVWIQGRTSDMINRGGLKVFPDEVEEALRRHPGVRDAAVAGVPDPRLGEIPHAWIITKSGDHAVLGELAAWCRGELAPYKVPAGFSLVSELPRSDIGKLLRRDLVRRDAAAG